jgi:hypothetical protein
MRSTKSVGRLIGLLLVFQISGFIVPFALLHPLTAGSQNWLANAAASSFQIKFAVFLFFVNCALTIAIGIAAWPVIRQRSERMGLVLLTVGIVMFCLQTVDSAHILSMVSFSKQYAEAAGQPETFQILAAAAGSTRRWVHLSELIAIDVWIFSFYFIVYRLALAPRVFSAVGLVTVMLHFVAIPLPLFLNYRGVTALGVPMAISHLALAVWLMVNGFKQQAYSEEGIVSEH